MRVLFLSVDDPFAGGSGVGAHLSGLSQALSKLGCEVHILSLNSKDSDRTVNGVHMHYLNPVLNIPFDVPLVKGLIFNFLSFKKVVKICRECKIDVIHGQSPSSYGYGLLRRGDVPFVVTFHATSFGEIGAFLDAPLSFVNKNFIFEAMSEIFCTFLTYVEYQCADKVVGVSEATAEEATRFYRLPKERVVAINNGIALPDFTDLYVEEENEEHAILSVGRLAWRKGFKYLIDAMPSVLSEYPDAKLFIVGDGYQRTPLQQYVRKLGLENSVLLLGKVSLQKLYSLYRKASVYVQPAIYEPCSIAILEAMSMGKPLIATRVGGVPEVVTNGVDGLVVEPRNSLQLAKAIKNIFSDSKRRKRFASNARKRVDTEFTWKEIAKKTLELYATLLNGKKKGT